ncbi:MAG: UvrD-helicase domain-containing protein [Anaerolineae bacterium]|nr:UvrD-helicase domain-containing protein [Anaerolineae bacterium]
MSSREPTAAQLRAYSTLDRNLLVNAGAGSGKTWVLAERFVHLLAHPAESGITSVSQIVAITFTTRAAQEMRARVRERLNQRLAAAADDDQRARWARHVQEMDGARISTIHALAAALLRANAAELDEALDPAFDVLDETQSRLLADAAVDDALRDTPPGDPALAVFAEYSADIVLEELRAAVTRPLPSLPADPLAHWASVQADLWEWMRPGVLAGLDSQLDFVPPAGLPPDDRRWLIWQEASAAVADLAEMEAGWGALHRLKAINLQGGSKKAWGDDAFGDAGKRLGKLRELAVSSLAWLGGAVDAAPTGPDAHAASLLACWYSLVERAQARYAELKAVRAAVDFDDLERLALALLEKDPVRARYDGAEFRHVMVDEFQDTSETQWAIIRHLANPARPGALFLVGDPKQSIYGFRGADARVFDVARREILNGGGDVIPLARSFRTHTTLVAQFNVLFNQVLKRDEASPAAAFQTAFSAADVMDAQRGTDPAVLPAVEFLLADKAESTGADDSGRAREAQLIAGRIQALHESGCDYGEIALLFRATTSMPEYEEALKDAGIPYVTIAGRGYFGRQEVWDVLALLSAVYQPDDALSLATALRSPLFALSDDALLALRWPDADRTVPDLWDALAQASHGERPGFPVDQIAAAAFAHAALNRLRTAAGRVPLASLIEQALDETSYRAVLSALPDGARRRGNVDKLVSKAEAAGPVSLGAFLQLLDDLTERETREGEAVVDVTGAVRLMTIHAAKGLEFPVVFLADAARDTRGGGSPALLRDEWAGLTVRLPGDKDAPQSFAFRLASAMGAARDDAERRRLLYVAATRARDRLIITAPAMVNQNGSLGKLGGLIGLMADAPGFDDLFAAAQNGDRELEWCGGPVAFALRREVRAPSAFESAVRWPAAPPGPSHPPALLAHVRDDRWAVARSLSATMVAELGKSRIAPGGERARLRRAWRGRVLREAPAHIGPVAPAHESRWFGRQVGEVVHRALRWYEPGMTDADLRAMLERFLWEDGLLPEARDAELLNRALELTRKVLASPLQREIEAARAVYRELPFAWDTGSRAIYGVLDVLFQRADGAWVLADYKTAYVADSSQAGLKQHAAQYHFQLAVYAAAVRHLLALPDLEVYIHYIRHQAEVRMTVAELDDALRQLEATIGQMMVEDAPG